MILCLKFTNSIPDNERKDYSYYFTCRSYLKMLLDGYSQEMIDEELSFFHGDEAFEVIKDFSNPEEIFQYFPTPNCFDCQYCEVQESCKYFEVMAIYSDLMRENDKNKIDQLNLSKLFKEPDHSIVNQNSSSLQKAKS